MGYESKVMVRSELVKASCEKLAENRYKIG